MAGEEIEEIEERAFGVWLRDSAFMTKEGVKGSLVILWRRNSMVGGTGMLVKCFVVS